LENLFKQNSAQKLRNDMYTFGMDSVEAKFPEEFLKRWLKATNPELKDEEVEEGFADFLSNLKWTIIENRIITGNNLEVKYDEVEEGFADFLRNRKGSITEHRMVTRNNLDVKCDEVVAIAKERIAAQIRMYYMGEKPTAEQLQHYATQLLSDREQAHRLFEE